MFYIMLERKTHLAKPSQVPPWAWHSTALWTIDWGWILGNIQIWLVSAPSTAYLSEIIESYGNAKRPTRDHQRDWNTDCTILHIPWRMSRFHLALSISRPSSALVHRIHGQRGPANVGPRVQELGTRNIQDSLKRWKKPFNLPRLNGFLVVHSIFNIPWMENWPLIVLSIAGSIGQVCQDPNTTSMSSYSTPYSQCL